MRSFFAASLLLLITSCAAAIGATPTERGNVLPNVNVIMYAKEVESPSQWACVFNGEKKQLECLPFIDVARALRCPGTGSSGTRF